MKPSSHMWMMAAVIIFCVFVPVVLAIDDGMMQGGSGDNSSVNNSSDLNLFTNSSIQTKRSTHPVESEVALQLNSPGNPSAYTILSAPDKTSSQWSLAKPVLLQSANARNCGSSNMDTSSSVCEFTLFIGEPFTMAASGIGKEWVGLPVILVFSSDDVTYYELASTTVNSNGDAWWYDSRIYWPGDYYFRALYPSGYSEIGCVGHFIDPDAEPDCLPSDSTVGQSGLAPQNGQVCTPPPSITDIEISPVDATTTKPVTFTAKVSAAPNFDITGYEWTETDATTGKTDFTGKGNPLTKTPDPGTHGKNKIQCSISYTDRNTGTSGTSVKPFEKEFNLFFNKYGHDKKSLAPNWFTYWNKIPGVGWTSAKYARTIILNGKTQPGLFNPDSNSMFISDMASTGGLDNNNRKLNEFDYFNSVIIHEGTHKQTWNIWWPGYNTIMWTIVQPILDKDSDYIPNSVEDVNNNGIYDNPPDPSDWNNRYTNGIVSDNEQLAHIAEASITQGAHKADDWANPGQQTRSMTTVSHFINDGLQLESSQSFKNYYSDEEYPDVDTNPSVKFINISRDYGYDSDGNGIFNYLTVVFFVNVTKSDTYSIDATFLSEKDILLIGNSTSYLGEGEQPLLVFFDGTDIGNYRQDGTFSLVSGSIYNQSNYLEDVINRSYVTQAYRGKDFERTESGFTNTFSDYAIDTNGDGFTDRLIIDAGVWSTNPENYRVQGTLYNSNNTRIKTVENMTYLAAGTNHVILQFDNITLIEQLANKSCSLKELTLYNENESCVDYIDTANGLLSPKNTNFPHQEVSFQNTYLDYGQDADRDGIFDYLFIAADLSCTKAGNYTINGFLSDLSGSVIDQSNKKRYLKIGAQKVYFDFDGRRIAQRKLNSSYQLSYVAILDDSSTLIDDRIHPFNTSSYKFTDFNQTVKANAAFVANITYGTPPLTVQFNDTSTGSPTSWNWIFGDGGTSTLQNPVHTYTSTGTYTVALTATNAAGSDTKTVANYITVNAASGVDNVGIYRDGVFSRNGATDIAYGLSTDTPVVGDWNGDHISEVGVYRGGVFYRKDATDIVYGLSTDTPVIGDWNGDGMSEVGVYRDGVFYRKDATDIVYGLPTDTPVIGDWNGDGTSEAGVWRNSDGSVFYLRTSDVDTTTTPYGLSTDTPIAGKWI